MVDVVLDMKLNKSYLKTTGEKIKIHFDKSQQLSRNIKSIENSMRMSFTQMGEIISNTEKIQVFEKSRIT